MNTQAMLEDLGHRVVDVYSGREALQKLEQQSFDLVITDHSMPQMNGSELARAIAERWPGLPVILATGYAELPPGAANELPRLPKPFTQGELAKAVAQHARAVQTAA
jgi:CheY-like chemotaxis protein